MAEFEITERTEPFTLDEVFSFIDDTNISKMDAHELKSRIADAVKGIREKAIEEFTKNMKNALNDWADNRRNGWKFLRNGEDLAMAKAYENAVDLVDIIVDEMRGAE